MSELRERLLERHSPKTEPVGLEGWEGAFVRQAAASERENLRDVTGAEVAALSIVDEEGEPILSAEDFESMSMNVVRDVIERINEVNGWSENGKAELGKGSSQTLTDTSPTPSATSGGSGTSTSS